jgi:hypothetical protein
MDEPLRYFSKRKPLKCPNCGARKVASIQYGLVSPELIPALDSDRIVLGGCCVTPSDPSWQCTECDTQIYNERLRTWFQENQGLWE